MKPIVSIVAAAAMMAAGSAVFAHGHGDHEEHGYGESHEHHGDHGKHLAKGHYKFDTHDHEITRAWCVEHRDRLPVGFRTVDRLSPQLEARLRIGSVLDVQLRPLIQPVPVDLVRLLPPPPVDLRYMAIGGHVALLDAAHRLHDLLPLPPLPF